MARTKVRAYTSIERALLVGGYFSARQCRFDWLDALVISSTLHWLAGWEAFLIPHSSFLIPNSVTVDLQAPQPDSPAVICVPVSNLTLLVILDKMSI